MNIDQALLPGLAMPQRSDLLERRLDFLCSIDKPWFAARSHGCS
jgi:hypothetical protein